MTEKINVLWFSNTPSNSDEYYDELLKGSGGWIKALDKELQSYVNLSIVFYHKEDSKFQYHQTTYYSIANNVGFFSRLYNRIKGYAPEGIDLNKYLAIIEEVKPDIIHIHGTENQFGCILNKTKIPIVVSIQGNLTSIVNKFFNGFERKYLNTYQRNSKSIKNLIAPWSFKVEYKMYLGIKELELKYLREMQYIMGRTLWDRRITSVLAPQRQYFHEDRILRDKFYVAQWKLNHRKDIVIHTTIGNSFFKGFETVCEALYYLNGLGLSCVWNIAGICNSDIIVKITKRKLKDKFPTKGLNLLGIVDENTLINHLLNSDMYVMPSHIENNANNLCEAMILGLPCISTFVGGVGSLITNEENGVLLQDGDPLALAGAIIEIKENPSFAIYLGNNARRTALIRHDKNRIVREIIQAYKMIISNENQKN